MKKMIVALIAIISTSCSKGESVMPKYFNPIVGTWERYYDNYHQIDVFMGDFKSISRVYIGDNIYAESSFLYTINESKIVFTRIDDGRVFDYKYRIEDDGHTLRIYSTGGEPGSIHDEVYSKIIQESD